MLAISHCNKGTPENKGSDRTICIVLRQEKASSIIPLIRKYVSSDAVIMTDFGSAFSPIFTELGNQHFKVNHSKQYQDESGVNNNMAESFFSRLRRSEFGTYNGMRHQYLAFYAAESAWRANTNKLSLRVKFVDVVKDIFSREPSKAFTNYNHGHRLGIEYAC